jgi:hypothetical protein
MTTTKLLSLTLTLGLAGVCTAADQDARVFEIRTYYAPQGRLDDLLARFRNHTLTLFEKHGMTNIGYWTPLENPDNKLIYILAFPSVEARDKSWKDFLADPVWQEVHKQTEANGRIVSKIESLLLAATDYSPAVKPQAAGDRVFELRTYTASPGNLGNLNARFRNHTLKLFAKHGITNIGYWNPLPEQPGADNTLIYILAHGSVEAAQNSFTAFRQDPDWLAARKASEEQAGGSLTVQDGVKSVFLKATDFSPLR